MEAMDGEHLSEAASVGQSATESPANMPGEMGKSAGSSQSMSPGAFPGQNILPGVAQELQVMLQDIAAIPGQVLPPETMHHLKNAGRETLLAVYSLWQNINRATKGASGEKVRKHIEVE